ncbi:DUF5807 family protein [Halanaeroarchaeum sulfurireducens]|uniref:Uncharacterized protein n=1 Tax=Halanaeroarchaeum sulfurireducens TaxID=1604004 RepID=A0A0F7PBP7_9EURY|nr:DUF5807 family protein [Halanaeroarchaeum sulfurireducens]AKH96763.1 hypothetical protein HLASF_0254 [Halanaeroarchaeum sulfurireducens]ALG81165.1 hypothetical protein HLASA_0254 [Halanaeroarchaeum sulfurireducens]
MTDDRVAAFLAGDRPDDVALYLAADRVSNLDALLDQPAVHPAGDGALLVVDGETGRSVFQRFTDEDAMAFTGEAMGRDGHVDATLTDGTCPDADGEGDHEPRFVFSFVEEQNEEVGGLYERGDVVHAYAQCSCGTAYSDTWVVDER